MESFSQTIKNEIFTQAMKSKNCCLFSFFYGAMFLAKEESGLKTIYLANAKNLESVYSVGSKLFFKKKEKLTVNKRKFSIFADEIRYSTIAEIEKNIIKCAKCRDSFLRGLFFTYGTVSDPNKSYRLELVFDESDKLDEILTFLESYGFNPRRAKRSNKVLLYFTKNEEVEEVLARLGTFTAAFSIMNSKINKDLRSSVNRKTNCDAANINKALSASQKYIEVINKLKELDMFDSMPETLKEAANLRIIHSDLSFAELGRMFNTPISKSGVYHRLERIVDFYNSLITK